MKDWIGNGNSIYKTLGASNHTDKVREENDYYATEPKAMYLLLKEEKFKPHVWECACGEGHLSSVLSEHGYDVKSSDIINRGYPSTEVIDFLQCQKSDIAYDFSRDIITNPPYKYAQSFVEKAFELADNGNKIAMFLKLTFLEGKARRKLFEKFPPRTIYVASGRLLCAKNGMFEEMIKGGGSAVAYAWFVWEKGYTGDTVVKWIN